LAHASPITVPSTRSPELFTNVFVAWPNFVGEGGVIAK
jgi:hypothetical protein